MNDTVESSVKGFKMVVRNSFGKHMGNLSEREVKENGVSVKPGCVVLLSMLVHNGGGLCWSSFTPEGFRQRRRGGRNSPRGD